MDELKAKRKSLRISFTTSANKLKQYFETSVAEAKDLDQLHVLKSQLQDKFTRLSEIQNEISSLLLENAETVDEYETDFEAAENYRDNYLELESKVETFLRKNSKSVSIKSSLEDNALKVKLPKFELKTFSGDPKEYLTFWSIFSKIHECEDLSVIDKFQYLYQTMVPDSKAARLVSSFPITIENYPKAIQQLKLRFGREDLLVQIYVRDLLSLVMKNAAAGNSSDLATLYDMLETKLRALESLGRTKEKFADFLEPLVESCLPENVLRAWERSRISENTDDATSQRSLEKLMCFLRHEVESEEMISLAREGFGRDNGSGVVIRKDSRKLVQRDEPTAATLISNTYGGKNNCIFCDHAHPSQDCRKIAGMSYEERKLQVMRKGCCLVCSKIKV